MNRLPLSLSCLLALAAGALACGVGPSDAYLVQDSPPGAPENVIEQASTPASDVAVVKLSSTEPRAERQPLVAPPGVSVRLDLTDVVAVDRHFKVLVGQMSCGWLGLAQASGVGQCYQRTLVSLLNVLPEPAAFTVFVIEDSDGDGQCSQTDRAWTFQTGYGSLPARTVELSSADLKPVASVPCYVDRP